MTISTKSGLSLAPKVDALRSKYKPMELCDDSVYDLAKHNYTLEQIAERFSVSTATIKSLHGDAFHLGKDESGYKPRLLMARFWDHFDDPDLNFANPANAKSVQNFLKAQELHARKYEGMGTKSEVTHKGENVDPSQFKFVPLTLENQHDSWTDK